MACSVALLFGSYRANSLGSRVVRFLSTQLRAVGGDVLTIDAATLQIPILEKTYQTYLNENSAPPAGLTKVHQIIQKADAFILVSGEYNHLPQPGLLNMINFFDKEYRRKPSGLVGYSTGSFGGARTEAPLRTITATLGMPSIPPMLCIAEAHHKITEDGHTENALLLKHSNAFCTQLIQTATHMQHTRTKN
jgi:NAD(P)H-dependent FMN reductase